MRGNLIITIGISGSGKSIWGYSQWLKEPRKITLVSRDSIRRLLFGVTEETLKEYFNDVDIFSKEREVTSYENVLIHEGLSKGRTVIVEEESLKYQSLFKYKFWNVPVTIQTTEVSLTEAVRRDMKRIKKVGDAKLKMELNLFKTLLKKLSLDPIDFTPIKLENSLKKHQAVVFSVDGVLCHRGDRRPLEWGKVINDEPNWDMVNLIKQISSSSQSPKIIICTSRDNISLFGTKKWLRSYGINYDDLYIREEKDYRPEWVVKEEMWKKVMKHNYIQSVVESAPQTIRRAKVLGLEVLSVEQK